MLTWPGSMVLLLKHSGSAMTTGLITMESESTVLQILTWLFDLTHHRLHLLPAVSSQKFASSPVKNSVNMPSVYGLADLLLMLERWFLIRR